MLINPLNLNDHEPVITDSRCAAKNIILNSREYPKVSKGIKSVRVKCA